VVWNARDPAFKRQMVAAFAGLAAHEQRLWRLRVHDTVIRLICE
jgi:hypothetical protein